MTGTGDGKNLGAGRIVACLRFAELNQAECEVSCCVKGSGSG